MVGYIRVKFYVVSHVSGVLRRQTLIGCGRSNVLDSVLEALVADNWP